MDAKLLELRDRLTRQIVKLQSKLDLLKADREMVADHIRSARMNELTAMHTAKLSTDGCFAGPAKIITHEMAVEELGMSMRINNCLDNLGIKTVGQLLGASEYGLLRCRNLGHSSIAQLQGKLELNGFPRLPRKAS